MEIIFKVITVKDAILLDDFYSIKVDNNGKPMWFYWPKGHAHNFEVGKTYKIIHHEH